jgi:peroxiredoxin
MIGLLGAGWSEAEEKGQRRIGPKVGLFAPDFSLKDLEDKMVSLSDFRGKFLLIVFWGTWCPPCIKEMPILQRFYEQYKKQMEIVGIAVFDPKESVRAFVEDKGIAFTILLDPRGDIALKYRVTKFPTSFFVNREGIIWEVRSGTVTYNYLVTVFKKMLKAPYIGSQAPLFTLKDLEDELVSLNDFSGKPLLLNFCAMNLESKKEMLTLQEFYVEYKEMIEVIGVNIDPKKKVIEEFAKENNITYTILHDPARVVFELYGVRYVPTSFFIDSEGMIQAIHVGKMSSEDLIAIFERLFKKR